jgi:hypothetical protein
MKMARRASDDARYLAHPVYLDVPMMVSFLAALDDGVAYTSEVAERLASTREGEGDAAVKAGMPSLAQWLGLTLSAEGKYRRRSSKDESVEAKLVREHTSASLFNILRQRLVATPSMKSLGPNADLSDVQVGDLVEVRGTINGDPLRRVMAFMTAIAPYLGWDLDGESKPAVKSAPPRRKGQPPHSQAPAPREDLESVEMIRILKADIAKSTVLDLVMTLQDGRHVVLSASNEYMTAATEQYMLAGSFSALGKVTQVLQAGEKVSLLRRTVFAIMEATGQSVAEDVFSGLQNAMPGQDFSNLAVSGPGLQVLPLAIYI